MSGPSLAAPLSLAAEFCLCCPMCGAEASEPADIALRNVTNAYWGDEDLLWGRDANGWLVVSYGELTAAYCGAHSARKCLRHASALLGVEFPEGLR